jgi:hypothetical protein
MRSFLISKLAGDAGRHHPASVAAFAVNSRSSACESSTIVRCSPSCAEMANAPDASREIVTPLDTAFSLTQETLSALALTAELPRIDEPSSIVSEPFTC